MSSGGTHSGGGLDPSGSGSPAERGSPPETRTALPRKILVVDDDPSILLLLQNTFKKDSEVLTATSAEEALACFEEHVPDCIVTDLRLPQMSGQDLIRSIRRTFRGVGTPILVLTARSEEGVLLECFRDGADDFIKKPFSPSELRTRVASVLLRSQVARDVNPLSRLPGNFALKREMERWLEQDRLFAIAYIDLDHFKAFNDLHGFDAGDEAILVMAEAVMEYARSLPASDVFLSHVGGDDFVLLISFDQVQAMAEAVHSSFSRGIRRFYSEEQLAAGEVEIVDRAGNLRIVPLLSASIAVVHNKRRGIDDVRKIAQIAAETKKMAKVIPGNSLFIDRRER
ncbi:MAG: GGDEF domain-containing response regulator [Planctomycetota bacterium]|jgi:diguanylate cyclase (GGDEF)-like protein